MLPVFATRFAPFAAPMTSVDKQKPFDRLTFQIVNRTLHILIVVFLLLASLASTQEIRTAAEFFDAVSAVYGEVEDYTCRLVITNRDENLEEDRIMDGILAFKGPNRVRIDFEEPVGQVLVSDGERLQVYIPVYNVVLQQDLRRRSEESLALLANEQGLNLLRTNYSIAYLDTPEPVPLEEGSDEQVVKLKLDWRSTNEGYRELILSISEDLRIRRIVGITVTYREVQFDFLDVETNVGIPDARFDYEAPASANLFNNFLFEGEG